MWISILRFLDKQPIHIPTIPLKPTVLLAYSIPGLALCLPLSPLSHPKPNEPLWPLRYPYRHTLPKPHINNPQWPPRVPIHFQNFIKTILYDPLGYPYTTSASYKRERPSSVPAHTSLTISGGEGLCGNTYSLVSILMFFDIGFM